MAVVDELVILLGARVAGDALGNLRNFSGMINNIQRTAMRAAAALVTFTGSAAYLINRTVSSANELQKLADNTGVSTQALQEWGYIAAKAGASANAVQRDIAMLTKTMASPIPGQFNLNLAMLGVSAYRASGELRTADEVLTDIGNKLARMSPQRAMQWASKVGISDDTLTTLRQGGDAIERLRQEAYAVGAIISERDIKRAAQFKREINTTVLMFKTLTTTILLGTLPVLEALNESFKEWMITNREWVSSRTVAVTSGLAQAWGDFSSNVRSALRVFRPLVEAIESITGPFDQMETWAHIFLGLITAIGIALSPVIAHFITLAAKIYLAQLVAEDLYGFFTGKTSFTGTWINWLLDRFPEIRRGMEGVKQTAADLSNYLNEVWSNAAPALAEAGTRLSEAFQTALEGIGQAFQNVFGDFERRYPNIVRAAESIADAFRDLGPAIEAVTPILEKTVEYMGKLYEYTIGMFGNMLTALDRITELARILFSKDPKWNDLATSQGRDSAKRYPGLGANRTPEIVPQSTSSREKYNEGLISRALASAFEMMRTMPAVTGQLGIQKVPTSGQKFELNQTIITSDPVTAGMLSAQLVKDFAQFNTPGLGPATVR